MRKRFKAQISARRKQSVFADVDTIDDDLWGVLDTQISDIERKIENVIAQTQRLASRARLLRSIPGIGPVGAAMLIAELPELGRMTAGHLPEREVMTGIGPVPVKVPRVRDRGAGEDNISFTPSILPRYLRKARSVEELLPWLYLKGVSTGDFTEALEALLGPNAKGLSAKTVTRLKADWWKDYEAWQKRDLGTRRFLYIWADGVYFKPRMAEEKQCVLVIVGADEYGRKELLAMTDGFRESTQSWRDIINSTRWQWPDFGLR
ncbi:transposase, Mutator family [Pseudosulfitobacter pseudonitzschiae]|uniref:Mutator family transposase n=1 Tax=Pseudosulfitobacter pseudonitzschiae TaxID=1402135 RepID=A0A221JXU7_9RHOB|nr:transposase, Mutator family [Pseudosulfitobacter pseudonitzschiae]